jgi:hypothetical protein
MGFPMSSLAVDGVARVAGGGGMAALQPLLGLGFLLSFRRSLLLGHGETVVVPPRPWWRKLVGGEVGRV